MSFFGFVVKSNSSHPEEVPRGCNLVLTQAATDKSASDPTTLYCQTDEIKDKIVICTLSWGRIEQARLDLIFESETKVTFSVSGKGDVHISGYFVEEELSPDFDSDEEDEEEVEEMESSPISKKKRKNRPKENVLFQNKINLQYKKRRKPRVKVQNKKAQKLLRQKQKNHQKNHQKQRVLRVKAQNLKVPKLKAPKLKAPKSIKIRNKIRRIMKQALRHKKRKIKTVRKTQRKTRKGIRAKSEY